MFNRNRSCHPERSEGSLCRSRQTLRREGLGKITTGFSMSLDGFVAGPNEDFRHLFAWMTSGDTEYTVTIGNKELKLKIAAESVERFDDAINTTGALVAGRRLYELTNGWGGHHPVGAPVVVVTHG